MRIGIVTTWFERGAAYVSRQYRRVLEKEHTVFIYARGGEERAQNDPAWDDDRVTWGAPPVVPIESAVDLDDFARWIRRNALELVFFNEQHWWPPVELCAEMDVRCGSYVDYYTAQTVPFFGAYDFLVCNTRRHFSVFEWHSQGHYVPWGTELSVFRPQSLEPVEPGKVVFFHSAGMNPVRKGTDLLVKAFAGITGQARLIIQTQLDVPGCLPDTREQLEDLSRMGRLEYIDHTAPAPGLYYRGDVYVYPSRLDGIGLTVPEALACGLPVIAPDHPPMNEFVTAESGTLVPVESLVTRSDGYYWQQAIVDVDRLRSAMQSYVDRSGEISTIKRRSRAHAEAHLDWYRNASGLAALFDGVRLLPAEQKKPALEQIHSYEEARSHHNLRMWLSMKHPRLVRAARTGWRAISGYTPTAARNG